MIDLRVAQLREEPSHLAISNCVHCLLEKTLRPLLYPERHLERLPLGQPLAILGECQRAECVKQALVEPGVAKHRLPALLQVAAQNFIQPRHLLEEVGGGGLLRRQAQVALAVRLFHAKREIEGVLQTQTLKSDEGRDRHCL